MTDLTPHFDRLKKRFAELDAILADGSIFSNQQKVQEVARERSRIKQSLDNFDLFTQVQRQMQENAAMVENVNGVDADFLALVEADQKDLQSRFDSLSLLVQEAILPPDPNEGRNVIMEIRAGTGGSEAALFAADLYRMYARFIERCGSLKCELLEASPSDLGGMREVILLVTGEGAFRLLKFESGVHRVQRVPATEAQGRIHTSTATVAVLPEARDVDLVIKPEDLRIEVCRSGGPGGQGVNTTDSAVQVMHIPTGLIVRCQDGRSQLKNREKALNILRSRLLEKKQQEEDQKYAAARKSQVGTGDRNEKIRTYNYPQNRITDHRINFTLYDLSNFMEGHIHEMLEALSMSDLECRLAAFAKE